MHALPLSFQSPIINGEPSPPGGCTGPGWKAKLFWFLAKKYFKTKQDIFHPGPVETPSGWGLPISHCKPFNRNVPMNKERKIKSYRGRKGPQIKKIQCKDKKQPKFGFAANFRKMLFSAEYKTIRIIFISCRWWTKIILMNLFLSVSIQGSFFVIERTYRNNCLPLQPTTDPKRNT